MNYDYCFKPTGAWTATDLTFVKLCPVQSIGYCVKLSVQLSVDHERMQSPGLGQYIHRGKTRLVKRLFYVSSGKSAVFSCSNADSRVHLFSDFIVDLSRLLSYLLLAVLEARPLLAGPRFGPDG
jgi:hypothetical protein